MTKELTISVIMSVYNGMPYLEEAVESILSQTYKKFEFIIVDDASTDNSWKYLKSLKDKRIKLLKNSKNLGLTKSLNRALKSSNGYYIARMDSDDISYSNRFIEQLKFLEKNKEISLCGTWADLINDSGEIIGEKKYPTDPNKVYSALPFYQCVIHPTFFARRELFTHLKGYNPKFDFAEDYELLMRARKKFRIANVGKKLIKWRLWEGRRSRSSMKIMDYIDLKIKIASVKRDGPDIYNILGLSKKLFFIYLFPLWLRLKIAKLLKLA